MRYAIHTHMQNQQATIKIRGIERKW